jgi:hypothetical protein
MFPYDNWNRRIRELAEPSKDLTGDEANIPWDNVMSPWDGFPASEKYDDILRIVGEENAKDIKHLDSAYKECCQAFFTRDTPDIFSHAQERETLRGLRMFHPDKNIAEFLAFLEQESE